MRILIGRLPKDTQATIRGAVNPDWHPVDHVQQRQSEKAVTDSMLRACLSDGRLIEVHNNAGSLRGLMRNFDGTCAVVDFDTRSVVTCYWNHPSDRHTTIRRSEYYWGRVDNGTLRKLGIEGGVPCTIT